MDTPSQRHRRILAAVRSELQAARRAGEAGDAREAFRHLERAHVLGQWGTATHVRVHWLMLCWALKHRHVGEMAGQLMRIAGAAAMTPFGWLPRGNTGGANVSAFRPMAIPPDLQEQIDRAG